MIHFLLLSAGRPSGRDKLLHFRNLRGFLLGSEGLHLVRALTESAVTRLPDPRHISQGVSTTSAMLGGVGIDKK